MIIVKEMEGKTREQRKEIVCRYLDDNNIKFIRHRYETGENIYVPSGKQKEIGISSHFDAVPGSPGANDNASSVAVTLYLLKKFHDSPLENTGVRGIIFDEEEECLKGSKAYVRDIGIGEMIGLYNMELTGQGDRLALWPTCNYQTTLLLDTIEKHAKTKGIKAYRAPNLINLDSDHTPFRKKGLKDAFCVASVTKQDIDVLPEYIEAMKKNAPFKELRRIIEKAPLFKNYHKPTDTSDHLSEESLRMVSDILYDCILDLQSTI